jgi:hypothetical protein
MSDVNKPTDQTEEGAEKKVVLQGIISTAVNVNERDDALSSNPNRSDGSLQKYADKPIGRSIEIHAVGLDGKPIRIDRENIVKERDLGKTHRDSADSDAKAPRQLKERISRSAMMLAVEAKHNPVLEPVHLTREYAESLPDSHPEKQKLTDLTRKQAAELSPDIRSYYEQQAKLEVSAELLPRQEKPEEVQNNLEGWLKLGEKIASLTPDQQFKLVCELIKQQQEIDRQKAIGGLIGTVEGLESITMDVCNLFQFAGDVMVNPERARTTINEVGISIWNAGVSGIQILDLSGQFGKQYTEEIIKGGDYTRPLTDAYKLGQYFQTQWDALSPLEQEKLKYRFATEAAGMLIPTGSATKLAKAEKVSEIVKIVVHDVKEVGGDMKKAAHALVEFLNALSPPRPHLRLQPAGIAPSEPAGIVDHLKNAGKNIKEHFEDFHNKMAKKLEPLPPMGDKGFRGDRDPWNPLHPKGWRKSHIDVDGDLVPANPLGVFKGKAVTITDHLDNGWRRYRKGNSPFTSFSISEGKIATYSDGGYKIELDVNKLKDGIAAGKLSGVEIIEHEEVITAIENSTEISNMAKRKQLYNARRDHEFLVRGIIPKGYFTVEKM